MRHSPFQAIAVCIVGSLLAASTAWSVATEFGATRGAGAARTVPKKSLHVALADSEAQPAAGEKRTKRSEPRSASVAASSPRVDVGGDESVAPRDGATPASPARLASARSLLSAIVEELSPTPQRRVGAAAQAIEVSVGELAAAQGSAVSLQWLARHQRPAGDWSPDGDSERCTRKPACADAGDPAHAVGTTAAALWAFLAAGLTPKSKLAFIEPATRARIPAAAVVTRAIEWLRERQRGDGFVTLDGAIASVADQAIAAGALCEAGRATGHADVARAGEAAFRAMTSTPRAQRDAVEEYWYLQAMAAAERAAIRTPRASFDAEFERATSRPAERDAAFTDALSLWTRLVRRPDATAPGTAAAVKRVVAALQRSVVLAAPLSPEAWHASAQAIWEFAFIENAASAERGAWRNWREAMLDAVRASAASEPGRCDFGSWAPSGEFRGGRAYATAVRTIAMLQFERAQ